MESPKIKLKILFLHGFLQSGEVLRQQLKPLFDTFESKNINIEAIFPDGNLSLSKNSNNKKTWMYWETNGLSDTELFKREEIEYFNFDNSINQLKNIFKENDNIDFIIGYSQGAVLIYFILLFFYNEKKEFQSHLPSLKGLVLISGFCNPSPSNLILKEKLEDLLKNEDYITEINSFHLIGKNDTYITPDMSLGLSKLFNKDKIDVEYHSGTHVLPSIDEFDYEILIKFIILNYTK